LELSLDSSLLPCELTLPLTTTPALPCSLPVSPSSTATPCLKWPNAQPLLWAFARSPSHAAYEVGNRFAHTDTHAGVVAVTVRFACTLRAWLRARTAAAACSRRLRSCLAMSRTAP